MQKQPISKVFVNFAQPLALHSPLKKTILKPEEEKQATSLQMMFQMFPPNRRAYPMNNPPNCCHRGANKNKNKPFINFDEHVYVFYLFTKSIKQDKSFH